MPEGENLFFRTIGKGEHVVFLHGFLESSSMWDSLQLTELNKTCVLIDLPGHGKSPIRLPEKSNLTLEDTAKQIIRFLHLLPIQKYHLVGHSLGSYIALAIKSLDNNCQKTLLMHSNFWQDDQEKQDHRLQFAELVVLHKERLLNALIPSLFFNRTEYALNRKQMLKEALCMDPKVMAAYAIAMKERSHHRNTMKQFPDDIAIIHGAKDPLIQSGLLTKEMKGLHNSVFNLQNAGHMSHFETPEVLLDLLKNTL